MADHRQGPASRLFVVWPMGNRASEQLVIDAVNMAAKRHPVIEGSVPNSNQDSQYVSLHLQKILQPYKKNASQFVPER